MTEPQIARGLVEAAKFYHEHQRWFCRLFLVMPDHLHAMLSFPFDKRMGEVVGQWKGYTAKTFGVIWQDNFFDHRLRSESEADETFEYILGNPVAKGLCSRDDTWAWQYRSGELP